MICNLTGGYFKVLYVDFDYEKELSSLKIEIVAQIIRKISLIQISKISSKLGQSIS